MTDRVAVAQLRLLVAVAQADGEVSERELAFLRERLGAAAVDEALANSIDVDVEIAALGADVVRRRTLDAAMAVAYADKTATDAEVALMRRIWAAPSEDGLLAQVMGEVRETLAFQSIAAEADPVAREHEILEDVLKYSTLAAATAAMPVPGVALVADLAVVAMQVKLVRDIASYWGRRTDAAQARELVVAASGGIVARAVLVNLARLVPVWGSAFAAATAFASTWAIGRAADRWYARGTEDFDPDAVRKLFESARLEGDAAWQSNKARVERARVDDVATALKQGDVSRDDWDAAARRSAAPSR